MSGGGVLAFLNLGLPETVVIGAVVVLLFAPKAARMLGGLARHVFEFKKGIDDAKDGITRTVSREIHDAMSGVDEASKPRQKRDRDTEA